MPVLLIFFFKFNIHILLIPICFNNNSVVLGWRFIYFIELGGFEFSKILMLFVVVNCASICSLLL